MTVETESIIAGPYVGNDTSAIYDYGFRIDTKDQIKIWETDTAGTITLLTVDQHYTVSGLGDSNGGEITRIAGNLPTGYKWYMRSDYQPIQSVDFTSQGGFFPDVHEHAFDTLTFLTQQTYEERGRTIRAPLFDSPIGYLPDSADRADTMLSFDSNGDPVTDTNELIYAEDVAALIGIGQDSGVLVTEDEFTGDGIETDFTISSNPPNPQSLIVTIDGAIQNPTQDYTISGSIVTFASPPTNLSNINIRNFGYSKGQFAETDSSTVTFLQAGTGTVSRTVQSVLRERVSVKDFGAVGDGVADDAPAIRKALDHMGSNPGMLIFPPGRYYVNTTSAPIYIPITRHIHMWGYGAVIVGPGNHTGTIFETAIEDYSTGASSNFGYPEQYVHNEQTFRGFEFENCRYAFKMYNWLNNTGVYDCRSRGTCNTFYLGERCWHTTVMGNHADANDLANLYTDDDASFHFRSFVNAQLIANNTCTRGGTPNYSGVGFNFEQGVAALNFTNNTCSKCDVAVLVKGAVEGGMDIHTAYLENNVNDIIVEDNNPKEGLKIDSCFFNNEGSGYTIYAEHWLSGELGPNNNFKYPAAVVDLSHNLNTCTVYLPKEVDGSGNEYGKSLLPQNWSVNGSCVIHKQYSTHTIGPGPSAQNYMLASPGLGPNYTAPKYYKGKGGMQYSFPFANTDTSTTIGDAYIDTEIEYDTRECGIRFDAVVTDTGGHTNLGGWVTCMPSGIVVDRTDANTGSITVTASNNSGFIRLHFTGFSTSNELTVTGGARLI